MNGWMKEEWSERDGINQFWLPGIGKLSGSSQSEPKLHKYNPVMWSYSLFALNSFISTLFKCSSPWRWFLFLPFSKLIVIFHQPLSHVPYSCHRCQCSQNSFLCSLWLSFSVPTSSLSLFFFFPFGDLIYPQIFHLYSASPRSVSLVLTSQTPSLN